MQGVSRPIDRRMGLYPDIRCTPLINLLQGPNLQCFINRVASHPERLQYIYFNTVLMLRAVERLRPYLSAYDYCSNSSHEDDEETLEKLSTVLNIAHEVGGFDETVLFRGENAKVSPNE
jgi:ERO1-like protein beta